MDTRCCPQLRPPLATLIACGLATAMPAEAQIRGQIVDATNGAAIPAAGLTLFDAEGDSVTHVVANGDGGFLVAWSGGAGVYTLRVEALGYDGSTRPIAYEGEPMLVHVSAAPAPVELEGLDVSVERRSEWLDHWGFYERRRFGQGDFVEFEDELTSTVSRSVQLFRSLPGVSIHEGREPFFQRAQQGLRGERCFPMIVVDNVPLRIDQPRSRISPDGFDVLVPGPTHIRAIEVYRSTSIAPPQWATNRNNCGVIAVWTKR